MKSPLDFERCLTFINCQLQPLGRTTTPARPGAVRQAVTISRQAGCGALVIGQKVAEYLQNRSAKDTVPWTVFDRNLVEKVLEDHDLPRRLAAFMPEDRISQISDILEELCGLHPPSWFLVKKTADTILHLAELGNVILIGRGSNIITSRLDYVFHVRLIGSLKKRLQHVQDFNQLDSHSAMEFIRSRDGGRRRYVKKYFHKDIDDPLLYHLIINTDLVSCDHAARIIGNAVLSRVTTPLPHNLPAITTLTK